MSDQEQVDIAPEIYDFLEEQARKNGMTFSRLLSNALVSYAHTCGYRSGNRSTPITKSSKTTTLQDRIVTALNRHKKLSPKGIVSAVGSTTESSVRSCLSRMKKAGMVCLAGEAGSTSKAGRKANLWSLTENYYPPA